MAGDSRSAGRSPGPRAAGDSGTSGSSAAPESPVNDAGSQRWSEGVASTHAGSSGAFDAATECSGVRGAAGLDSLTIWHRSNPFDSRWRVVKVVSGFLALLGAAVFLGIAAAALHSVVGDYFFTQGTVGGLMHRNLTPIVLALASSQLVRFLITLFLIFAVSAAVFTTLSELAALDCFPGNPVIEFFRRNFVGSAGASQPPSRFQAVEETELSHSLASRHGLRVDSDDENEESSNALHGATRSTGFGGEKGQGAQGGSQENSLRTSSTSCSVWWHPLQKRLRQLLATLLLILGYRGPPPSRDCALEKGSCRSLGNRRGETEKSRQSCSPSSRDVCFIKTAPGKDETGSEEDVDIPQADSPSDGVRRRADRQNRISGNGTSGSSGKLSQRSKFDNDWLVVEEDDSK
ncbi:putative transmembrane protein [Toxoplasma gondii MAS]|uniref:Putative transmembrane protein n=2 Tax=Toxoplasma gondii TaxID=5811 RepID=A0A086QI36_TOXGO|nr:putative transmembrane protein [Toxoplasma gondii MAS]PUA90016.1 putative transmembrane protein [Toxoplasma gondii TgCATBr9]